MERHSVQTEHTLLHLEAGRVVAWRGRSSLRQTRPEVPTCAHANVYRASVAARADLKSVTYACLLPDPGLIAAYRALALHRHPVPVVTSLNS